MLNSSILDVAIGMAFIYLLLSLIASTIQEALASLLQTRSANLEHGIRSLFSNGKLLDDVHLVDRFYRHGLIMGLYREPTDGTGNMLNEPTSPVKRSDNVPVKKAATGDDREEEEMSWRQWLRTVFHIHPSPGIDGVTDPFLLPAYIPARTFAITLLDILKTESAKQNPPQSIAEYLNALCKKQRELTPPESHPAAEAMLALLADAESFENGAEKFRCHLENWYNDAMDRVSGWYKKYTQNFLLVIGLLLALVFNVDSINVGKKLWFDKDARSGLISAAGNFVDKHTETPKTPAQPGQATLTVKELAEQMKTTVQSFNEVSETFLLPVGWHYSLPEYEYLLQHPEQWRGAHIASQLAGWIITALALSLGAPFWFDLLNKFMVVRSTVKPSEKSRTEASKDAS